MRLRTKLIHRQPQRVEGPSVSSWPAPCLRSVCKLWHTRVNTRGQQASTQANVARLCTGTKSGKPLSDNRWHGQQLLHTHICLRTLCVLQSGYHSTTRESPSAYHAVASTVSLTLKESRTFDVLYLQLLRVLCPSSCKS